MAMTWKLKLPLAKPCLAQALKWFLVVMVPEVRLLWRTDHCMPLSEIVFSLISSGFRRSSTYVLGEGAGTGDGRLVGAGVGALLVGGTVGADRANLSDTAGARVEATVALDDVVLSLGAVGPAVDCEVGAAVARVVGGRVVDGAGRTSRPADANDDVGAPAPLGREGTGTEAVLETSGLTVVVLDLGVQG